MARFNYSGVAVTAGSGRLNSSLGGTVLLKNGVVRNYVTPTNPQTAAQTAKRALFSSAVNTWKGVLTDAQRAAYDVAAATDAWKVPDPLTGTLRNLTGEQLFIQLYMNVDTAQGDVTDVYNVPTPVDMSGVALGTLTAVAGTTAMNLAYSGTIPTGAQAQIFASPAVSPGRMKIRNSELRQISIENGATPFDLLSGWEATFGALNTKAGQKVFVKVFLLNEETGQRVSLGTASDIVAA